MIMATYSAPKFNKTAAAGASTHHCKTKMKQKTNDREQTVITSTQQKSGSVELMTGPSIHNLGKDINKSTI